MEFVRCDKPEDLAKVNKLLSRKGFKYDYRGSNSGGFYVCREQKEFSCTSTATDVKEIEPDELLRLMRSEVIHCPSSDEYKRTMSHLGKSFEKRCSHRLRSCLLEGEGAWEGACVDPGGRDFCPRSYYEDLGYEVVSLDEFIRRRTVVHCRYPSEKNAFIRHLEQSGHKLYHANIREVCCNSSESLINLPASGEDEVRCMTQDEIKAKGYVTTVMAEDFLKSNFRKIAVLLPDEQSRQLMIRYFNNRYYGVPAEVNECLDISHHKKLTTNSKEHYRNLGYQILAPGEFLLGMRSKTVVHCKSKEEWDAVLSYFGDNGITWSTGLPCCLQRSLYGSNDCINIDPSEGLNYGRLSYYKDEYNILSAKDFLKSVGYPSSAVKPEEQKTVIRFRKGCGIQIDKIKLVNCDDANEWRAVLENFSKDVDLRWQGGYKPLEVDYCLAYPCVYIGQDCKIFRTSSADINQTRFEVVAAKEFLGMRATEPAQKSLLGKIIACRRASEWRIVLSYLQERGVANAESISVSDFHETANPRIFIDEKETAWLVQISDENARKRCELVSFWRFIKDMRFAVSLKDSSCLPKICKELASDGISYCDKSLEFAEGFCVACDHDGMLYASREHYESRGYKIISSESIFDVPSAISFSSESNWSKVLDYFKRDKAIAAENASLIADRRCYESGIWLVVSGDKLFYSGMVDKKPDAYTVISDSGYLDERCKVAEKPLEKAKLQVIRCPTEIHWINALAGMPSEIRWKSGESPLDKAHLYRGDTCICLVDGRIECCDGDSEKAIGAIDYSGDLGGTIVRCRNNKDAAAVLRQAQMDGAKTLTCGLKPTYIDWYGTWPICISISNNLVHYDNNIEKYQQFNMKIISCEHYIASRRKVAIRCRSESQWRRVTESLKKQGIASGMFSYDLSNYVDGYKNCISVSEHEVRRGQEDDYRANGFRIVSASRYLGDLNWRVCAVIALLSSLALFIFG